MKKSFLFAAVGVLGVAVLGVWMMSQSARTPQPGRPSGHEMELNSASQPLSPSNPPAIASVANATITLAVTNVAAVSDPAGKDKAALKIILPPKLTSGTPKTVKNVNIAADDPAITLKPRRPFFVPTGADVLLSAGKKVTSGDPVPPVIGSLDQITDGVKNGDDGYFVVLAPGKQWIQIDLGESCIISAIVMWHYHMASVVYRDVIVQVADDPDFINNPKTLFNNDNDNTSGLGVGKDFEYFDMYEGKLIDANGINARFVRFYSCGNTTDDSNHYIEVEVYGKRVK